MDTKPGWNPEDPLGKIVQESGLANAALHRYAIMGKTRSLRKLADAFEQDQRQRDRGDTTIPQVPTTSFATLAGWSSKYDWQNRVMQWEMLQHLEEEERWKERRKKVREDDWSHATELRELAERIITAAPAFIKRSRRVVDDGKPQIVDMEGTVVSEGRPREIVVTVALSISDLEKVEKLASRLARLAAEMDESRKSVRIDWREEARSAGLDPTEAYEQLVSSYVTAIRRGNDATDGGGAEGSAT